MLSLFYRFMREIANSCTLGYAIYIGGFFLFDANTNLLSWSYSNPSYLFNLSIGG